MRFAQLNETDWRSFLNLVAQEGWQISFQEQRLLQGLWRPYLQVLYAAGEVAGFVSAVAYRESGWIGNLLVPEAARGKGYGSALFDYALNFLRGNDVKRIWLTASETGRPMYERRGFRTIDRIDRWCTVGTGAIGFPAAGDASRLIDFDSACWGESRAPLLRTLADDGYLVTSGQSLGLLQPGMTVCQLGPWLSENLDVVDNRNLLQQAQEMAPRGRSLVVDVTASSNMELVLRTSGFEKIGTNQLMVLSEENVTLQGVVALASLGSIG